MSSSKRKKERRAARKARNIAKQKKEQKEKWERGGIILENHNNSEFSPEYCIALANRLVEILTRGWNGANGDNERFIVYYQMFKNKIKGLMLLWNDTVPKTPEVYYFLKRSLEIYWDDRENLHRKLFEGL